MKESDTPLHGRERRLPSGAIERAINLRKDVVSVYDGSVLSNVIRHVLAVHSSSIEDTDMTPTRGVTTSHAFCGVAWMGMP